MFKFLIFALFLQLFSACSSLDHTKRGLSSSVSDNQSEAFHQDFIFPIENYRLTSGFKWRRSHFHQGIDLVASKGTPILAIEDGEVLFAGKVRGYGNYIIVEHNNGFKSSYSHASKIMIKKGDFVSQGETIALVGNTGRATCSHLHFEISFNDQPIDPSAFLADGTMNFKYPRPQTVKVAKKSKKKKANF